MAGKSKAVALAGAHGSKGIEAGVKYCPLEHRANQRAVILTHLKRRGSISTAEARRLYSVMSPASRILELRRQGLGIITRRDPVQKCARYHMAVDPAGGDHAIE
jgi:hypothetical protein